MRTRDASVGKNDVQSSVPLDGVIHDGLDSRLVGGVELARVDLTFWVEGLDLLLVVAEELVVKVTDVDSLCAVLSVLVRCSSSYSQRGICAYNLLGKCSMSFFQPKNSCALRKNGYTCDNYDLSLGSGTVAGGCDLSYGGYTVIT